MTDQQWLQASLPVRAGGLGIRSVSSLASSTFLASAAGTRDLQDRILCLSVDVADEAFDLCLEAFPMQPPTGSAAGKQKNMGQCHHRSGIQIPSRLLFIAHSHSPTSGSSCATQWRLASHSTHSGLWTASQDFIKEIGRRTTLRTSDPRETAFLFQRISIALQRFNSVCLTNTFTTADQSSSSSDMLSTGFRHLT
jgi:hypothetical protein